MLRTIDRNKDQVIQKITKIDGTLVRYQYGRPGYEMTVASTLGEARVAIGKVTAPSLFKGETTILGG